MKKLLVLICFLFATVPSNASEALQARDEGLIVTLFTAPCQLKKILLFFKGAPNVVAVAEVSFNGESRQACWTPILQNGEIVSYFVVDEKGGYGNLEASYFKPVTIH